MSEAGPLLRKLMHREKLEDLRSRALRLTYDAYAPDAPWQLRDEALPLVLDCMTELESLLAEPEGTQSEDIAVI